jgi:hypothetical protein
MIYNLAHFESVLMETNFQHDEYDKRLSLKIANIP